MIAILDNNLTARELCPLCGKQHKDANAPLWFFAGKGRARARARALCAACAYRAHPAEAPLVDALCRAFDALAQGRPAFRRLVFALAAELSRGLEVEPTDARPPAPRDEDAPPGYRAEAPPAGVARATCDGACARCVGAPHP